MRIVLLGSFALQPKGTVSQRALPLGRALVRRGHEVWLLVPPYDQPAHAGHSFRDSGVQVEQLTTRWGPIGWASALARRATALQPEVIHAFKPTGPAAAAAVLLARRYPVVLDLDDWEGWGGFASSGAYPLPVAALLDLQERLTPRLVHHLTCASRTLVWRARRRGTPRQRVHYLPNCADPAALVEVAPADVAHFRQHARAGEAPIVLSLGHVPLRHDLDLAAAALLPLAQAAIPFVWAIVGDGPGLAALQRQLPPLLATRTRFLGRLTRGELSAALAASRLLLVPARDTPINRAKCAMKVVDALAAGLPVVAPDLGQHREYVRPGQTGMLTPPNDLPALTAAVRHLLADPALARRLGQGAAAWIRGGYTWDHWVGQAERVYRAAQRTRSGEAVYHTIDRSRGHRPIPNPLE